MNDTMPEMTAAAPAKGRGPARYDRAFIVTYGRSGSTLLQGVVNSLPGYLMRGENLDMLASLQTLYEKFPRFSDLRGDKPAGDVTSTVSQPHFGFERFTDATLAQALRRLSDTMLCADEQRAGLRCLGFKEIHYTPENVAARVDLLRTIWPGSAIIYNTRKPQDVAESEFQRNKSVAYFARFNDMIEGLASIDPHSHLVRYEDVVEGSRSLLGLYRFLGEKFNPKRFAAVLAVKHSYHRGGVPGASYSNIPATVQVQHKLPGVALFVVQKMEPARKGGGTMIEGVLAAKADAAPKKFARLVNDQGAEIAFTARYGLPSPKLVQRLGSEAAGKSRFRLSFERSGPGEHRLFFEGGELAAVVRPQR